MGSNGRFPLVYIDKAGSRARVLQTKKPFLIKGKILRVEASRKEEKITKEESKKDRLDEQTHFNQHKLYVGNIPSRKDTTLLRSQILNLFQSFGTIGMMNYFRGSSSCYFVFFIQSDAVSRVLHCQEPE